MTRLEDIAVSQAKRYAAEILRVGWRPDGYDILHLRHSAKYPEAYPILECAWHKAGFPIAAIKKMAARL
jgi:hypothetical protein